mmetsp:Transcript_1733/g.1980  ORF Transcript_1733/g.1980 Transcript_1733/m.1980 type:complete len:122 (-) Transcript_1733:218-583(-)
MSRQNIRQGLLVSIPKNLLELASQEARKKLTSTDRAYMVSESILLNRQCLESVNNWASGRQLPGTAFGKIACSNILYQVRSKYRLSVSKQPSYQTTQLSNNHPVSLFALLVKHQKQKEASP